MAPTDVKPRKVTLLFYRSTSGSEPVREWLKELPEVERQAIGMDLLRAQWRWPVGMPLCRPMGGGLWEIRTDLATKRTARVLTACFKIIWWRSMDLSRRPEPLQKRIWRSGGSDRRSWSNERKALGFEHRCVYEGRGRF